jgi:hypothetical protein
MSYAAAANPIDVLDETNIGNKNRNYNMEDMRGSSDPPWPDERLADWDKRWLHSDIKNVALPYVYHTFDEMLKLGDFKP